MKRKLSVLGFLMLFLMAIEGCGIKDNKHESKIVSGNDLGVRIDSRENDIVYGTFMVRVEGKWHEVRISPRVSTLNP
jgi:hypothetical protein